MISTIASSERSMSMAKRSTSPCYARGSRGITRGLTPRPPTRRPNPKPALQSADSGPVAIQFRPNNSDTPIALLPLRMSESRQARTGRCPIDTSPAIALNTGRAAKCPSAAARPRPCATNGPTPATGFPPIPTNATTATARTTARRAAIPAVRTKATAAASAEDEMKRKTDLLFLKPLREVLAQLDGEEGLPYPHGFFLPHVMDGYKKTPLKIFYYGLDTKTWMGDDDHDRWGYQVMMDYYRSGELEKYITNWNNAWPATTDDILAWGNRIAFWPFVIRLHLLMTKGVFVDDLNSIPKPLLKALMTFGYGNINSVEEMASLRKEGWEDKTCWDAITNIDAYHKARALAQEKILFKDVLDAFTPDCVFIHTWSWSEDVFFRGLNWRPYNVRRKGKWAAYTIDGFSTKILCMPHPNSRGFPFYDTIRKAASIMTNWLSKNSPVAASGKTRTKSNKIRSEDK